MQLIKTGTSLSVRQPSALQHWRCHVWLVLTLALLSSFKAMAIDNVPDTQRIGTGNLALGKTKTEDNRCQECHGAEGLSDDERIPNHAGQSAGYIIKQLSDFQTGKRNHQTMNLMAEDLDASDKADIAAYFASKKVMQGEPINSKELAKTLFINGDPSRDLPPCVSCHGENGKGRVADNVFYPVIGGQRRVYLRTQLLAWQMGDRTNSPDNVMNKVAKSLTDQELQALADYISGL